jgi:hypothetical protein
VQELQLWSCQQLSRVQHSRESRPSGQGPHSCVQDLSVVLDHTLRFHSVHPRCVGREVDPLSRRPECRKDCGVWGDDRHHQWQRRVREVHRECVQSSPVLQAVRIHVGCGARPEPGLRKHEALLLNCNNVGVSTPEGLGFSVDMQ